MLLEKQNQVLNKVTRYIRENPDCPIPVDLMTELSEAGMIAEDVVQTIRIEEG
jgi:hypothetical protein